jgi:hypothetical protein
MAKQCKVTYTQKQYVPGMQVKSKDWIVECHDSDEYPNGNPVPLVEEDGLDWRDIFEDPDSYPSHVITQL